jgi:hypothetical protein
MMKCNQLILNPKALLMTALLLVPAVVLPGAASAAETLTGKGYFSQLLDGDVQLAPVGQRGGLHMTFGSASDAGDAFDAVHADRPGSSGGIHLSVRMPWK